MANGFIGNPVTGENLFDPNLPISGITGWTGTLTPEQVAQLPWNSGVQPAGGAYDIGGNAQSFRNLGVDEETIEGTVYAPEQILQAGKTLLEAAYDISPERKKELEAKGRVQVKKLQNLVNNEQVEIQAAGRATVEPWLNEVKQEAAAHKYRENAPHKRPIKMGDGWGVFDPVTGTIEVLIGGSKKIPSEKQAALNAMERAWVEAQFGNERYLPDLERASELAESIKATRKSLGIEETSILPAGGAGTNAPAAPRVRRYNPQTRTFE